ncbi:MAG: hypothetical protein HC818_02820, partial [Synechococcaceae cyanobacterium RM1_1_27]|nr:hypothetical protein [Synechococcaceae cyanobacterium RM1_1_27]
MIIYSCLSGERPPISPVLRITLPKPGSAALRDQSQVLLRMGCSTDTLISLVRVAQGNFRYLHLAYALVRAGLTTPSDLRPGLDFLYTIWWRSLDATGQRLARLLAVAGEPLPLTFCTAQLGTDPRPLLRQWATLGIVAVDEQTVAYDHWSVSDYFARQQPNELAQLHAEIAALGYGDFMTHGAVPQLPGIPSAVLLAETDSVQTAYLTQQFARHAALSTRRTRAELLPMVATRPWVRARERRSATTLPAASDVAWELREAVSSTDQPVARLVRAAVLTGTLVSLARTMKPDAAVAA